MFRIKNATLDDIDLIRDLTFRVWPQTYAHLLTPDQIEYMLDLMYSEHSLKKQISEGCQFLIVYDSKEPVGFASFQETEPQRWKLHKLYVLTSQQGKGTGRFLIDHIMGEIKKRGGNYFYLQVHRENKAKDFYDRLGFKIRESIELDIGKGYFMTDYIMEKDL